MEVPKEVVEVLKNAQVKLQDCLDCVYEDRDPPNESDCLAADRTHTLAKLMNNNTVAQLEAIFDFEDMDESSGSQRQRKRTPTRRRLTTWLTSSSASSTTVVRTCLAGSQFRTSSSDILSHFECIPPHSKPSAALALSSVHS